MVAHVGLNSSAMRHVWGMTPACLEVTIGDVAFEIQARHKASLDAKSFPCSRVETIRDKDGNNEGRMKVDETGG